MTAKRNHSASPDKVEKKNPLYREHRLLPRKRRGTGTPAQPPVTRSSPKEKKGNQPPGEVYQAETGGPDGPEPIRYGDWERKGRCVDF